MQLTNKRIIAAVIVLFAVYFPIAVYFEHTYVRHPDPPNWNQISGPFAHEGGYSWAFVMPREFDATADTAVDLKRSTMQLYEDGKPIGPAHARHVDIANLGGGRYSHWRVPGGASVLIFSATDNTNPNENSRRYSYKSSAKRYPPQD